MLRAGWITRDQQRIKAYSQRLMPPHLGQVQIAECGRARALTLDCKNWGIQRLNAVNDGQAFLESGRQSFMRSSR